METKVWVITAYNVRQEQIKSEAVFRDEKKAEEHLLWLYANKNDGFTYYKKREHEVQ